MKNYLKASLVVLAIIVIGALVYINKVPRDVPPPTPIVTENDIRGCYVATLGKDIYTLTILSQQGESFKGTLSFKNFEKDSSSGTFKGIYKTGILLGDYSFNSEGINSIMQVIFKKLGNSFIRGFGDMNNEGTRFADINKIIYDSSYVFEASVECENTKSS